MRAIDRIIAVLVWLETDGFNWFAFTATLAVLAAMIGAYAQTGGTGQ